jgi:ankyrin repeat protein
VAASRGHQTVVQLLLAKGVIVDAESPYGKKALYEAAGKGYEKVVQLLLEKGPMSRRRIYKDG